MQTEPAQAQPVEADLPLNSKDAALACGNVLKLDDTAFEKLGLIKRLSAIVDSSGFTREEKSLRSAKDLRDEAFSAYSLAYLTWDKPKEVSRATLDKAIVDSFHSEDLRHLSSDEKADFDTYTGKFKGMMLKAFELGRHDTKISPCPF